MTEPDNPGEDGQHETGADERHDHRAAPNVPVHRTFEREQRIHERSERSNAPNASNDPNASNASNASNDPNAPNAPNAPNVFSP
jgi:hypothetical protein